jgi:hypothetical protein
MKNSGRLIVCALIGFAAHSASAQLVCTAPSQPLFDFQVDRPATFIVDSAVHPHPSPGPMGLRAPLIVKFIVDTSGRVDSTTFEVLKQESREDADRARAVLRLWRYRPAQVGLCTVPQLIQTAVFP